jgi:serine/threonine-protein kinase
VASLPPSAKYEAGTLILNKYRLEHKLGEGGMGSVWAAHHVPLDRTVAIKVIRSDTNRQELAPRLLQEARAAAKLGHPGIVRVFDVGQTAEGDPFIVMELLEGESLNERLEREHRLSPTETVRLLLPIADALRAAHAKGIVHRDIKPDNVFLVSDETGVQPKVVDFGIAKLFVRDFDSQLTQRGVIVGSPDYMAPEQARGQEDIDPRADIWAFSVLLYETMSGQPPFEGNNYNALLRAIVESTPPSLTSLCAADAELAQLVDTGMAKDRTLRWQTMQAFGEALALWLLKQGVFEDAAGGSIEARWVQRRSEPDYRRSRPSFGSIPGYAATMPGLGQPYRPSTTEQRRAAEAPTSFGPVVTGTQRARRRFLVPIALGLVAVAGLSARLLWRSTSGPHAKVAPASAAASVAPPMAATDLSATPSAPAVTIAPAPLQTEAPEALASSQAAKTAPGRAHPKRLASSPTRNPELDLLKAY